MNLLSITLRSRKYKNKKGIKYGYFIDIYEKGKGKRRKEYLKGLFTLKDYATPIGTTKKGKPKHRKIEADDLMTWAEIQRQVDKLSASQNLKKGGLSFYQKQNQNFVEYYKESVRDKRVKGKFKFKNDAYSGSYYWLDHFTNGFIAFKDVTPAFLEELYFSMINDAEVHSNTAYQYMNHLKFAWKKGMADGYAEKNPFEIIKVKKIIKSKIKPETHYLTQKQINSLAETMDCIDPVIAKGFLFSIYQGFRYSDIRILEWSQVDFEQRTIKHRQKKSKKEFMYFELHDYSIEILKSIQSKEGAIFPGLPLKSSNINYQLKKWARVAGLNLNFDLGFHHARHTFGTHHYRKCRDIYSTMEAMGHSSVLQTQRYAKIDQEQQRRNLALLEAPEAKIVKMTG